MGKAGSLFHPEFKAKPYWWEAAEPRAGDPVDVPARTSIAVVGSGYAGLSAALELAHNGTDVTVIESNEFGFGGSTRNGGAVSGGIFLGKGLTGSGRRRDSDERMRLVASMMRDGLASFELLDSLIKREGIECFWERSGRFVGAFAPKHYDSMARRLDMLNEHADAGASMLPRERQSEEIASDYYFGGMVVERSGKLHPALYHQGLLAACREAGVRLCSRAEVQGIDGKAGAFKVKTSRGTVQADEVIIATNGYTGAATPELKRRLMPVASHIIATEELPEGLAASLMPKRRTIADTPRILCYYRMSPDGKRVIFGGRAKFTQVDSTVSAPILHRFMTDRFPQLKDVRITHAWTGNVAFAFDFLPHMGREEGKHYCLACNGSGVAMMTYLGYQTARKILGNSKEPQCTFDDREFPTVPFYSGTPWFLPIVGNYYRMRDRIDRMLMG
jgi:glycine/D-amino acid oxidase-like deaminating enzyme